ESEIRLVCIDPNKVTQANGNMKPDIVQVQPLGNIGLHQNRMAKDIGRRVNGTQLAYDEGVLVCPTNAGEVFGVDVMTKSLAWSQPTGDLPSGQGVASKGIYYLPLKKGEILAVDIAKGEIKAHNRAAVAGAAPGNLVFYDNMVLTQTTTEVMAYPQLSARLDA